MHLPYRGGRHWQSVGTLNGSLGRDWNLIPVQYLFVAAIAAVVVAMSLARREQRARSRSDSGWGAVGGRFEACVQVQDAPELRDGVFISCDRGMPGVDDLLGCGAAQM